MRLKVIAAILLTIEFPIQLAIAAEPNCTELLAGGVFDHRNITDVSATRNRLRYAFCKDDSAVYSAAIAKAASLGIDLPGVIGIQGSGAASEASFRSWRSWLCSDTDFTSSQERWYSDRSVVASSAILNAFNQCVAQKGFKHYAERVSDDGGIFLWELQYETDSERSPQASISFDTRPAGTTCTLDGHPAPNPIEVGKNGRPLLCERDPCRDVVLVARSTDTTVTPPTIVLERWKPAPPPTPDLEVVTYTTMNDMKAPFSFNLPPQKSCQLLTKVGSWYPHCPNKNAVRECPGLAISPGQAASGQFDYDSYMDDCGQCTYTVQCSTPLAPSNVTAPSCTAPSPTVLQGH